MADDVEGGRNPDPAPGSTERPRRPGLSRRGERAIEIAGVALCGLFAFGWTWSIANAKTVESFGGDDGPSATRTMAAAITEPGSGVTYVKDAALEALVNRARGA